ncbi:class I SAM-dependent methyltransferase [Blastomonas sp. AAP53]|uniref:class I SAM-dependent methyltransferase n=1 Tax=Blastomonas sp. AAP53 TaxID=1248760 RepID=UPI0003795E3C|nr:class I SAM-dependent methyltransferase [Blastomonas sp. AAP53]
MTQLMPHAACNHCGSRDARLAARVDGYTLVRCVACDLAFVADPPSPERLSALYQASNEYHRTLHDPASGDYARMAKVACEHLAFVRRWASGGRLVDVGCSTGLFLNEALRVGFDVSGVEFSATSAQFARDQFGIRVIDGDIHALDPAPESLDILTMFDVIEHVRDPASDIAAAYRMLKPGGLFIVSTPNIDGLFPRASEPLAGLLGHWPHPEPPWHLYQFSVRTLSNMLKKQGFAPLGTQHTAIDLAYSFGTLRDLRRSPKRLAYALAFAPLAWAGPKIGMGDWFYLAARKT